MFSDLESFLLIPTFTGFRFLPLSIFENIKNTENLLKLSFRGMICSDLEYFSKHYVCLRQNSQGITQNYQCKPSNEA